MPRVPIDISEIEGRIQVAIITVRVDEFDAVEKHLIEPRQVRGGNNAYEYSVLNADSGDSIPIVLTRCVLQGNSSAQAVAANVLSEINPAWLFLVGIAGGVPDNEFSLGDVVIASSLHDFSFGGAEEGKPDTYHVVGGQMHTEVDRFLQTGIAGRNRETLLTLAGFLNAPEFTTHPELLPVGMSLESAVYGEDKNYREKVMGTLSARFPSGVRKSAIRIWPGACGNKNQVVKDTQLIQEWLSVCRQLSHVETELVGVYQAARSNGRQNYPLLAVRGISDIVGLRRHPEWTEYACKSAGAFAIAIVKSGLIDFTKTLPFVPSGGPKGITLETPKNSPALESQDSSSLPSGEQLAPLPQALLDRLVSEVEVRVRAEDKLKAFQANANSAETGITSEAAASTPPLKSDFALPHVAGELQHSRVTIFPPERLDSLNFLTRSPRSPAHGPSRETTISPLELELLSAKAQNFLDDIQHQFAHYDTRRAIALAEEIEVWGDVPNVVEG